MTKANGTGLKPVPPKPKTENRKPPLIDRERPEFLEIQAALKKLFAGALAADAKSAAEQLTQGLGLVKKVQGLKFNRKTKTVFQSVGRALPTISLKPTTPQARGPCHSRMRMLTSGFGART